MSERAIVVRELAVILRTIAHPDRMRILARLSQQEKDVKSLLYDLDLPGARVSQHLSLLRAHRIVDKRRVGRRHLYSIVDPQLVRWILQGLDIIESRIGRTNAVGSTPLDA